jgi:Predicted metal binding domain
LPQFVDLSVSRRKFDREIADFHEVRRSYERRGWFLVEAEFPMVFVLLTASQLRPSVLVVGVLFDYTNYDSWPPSVILVDPFTREPYPAKDLPTALNRALPSRAIELPGVPGQLQVQGAQPLMQAQTPDEVPFLCLAGVREYHNHPGHSGDVWELHRSSGAGRLVRLLEAIHKYGVAPIRGFGVNLVPQVGLDFGDPPA